MAAKQAAPGALDLVRLFVNTLEVESGHDELDSPAALEHWLKARSLLPPEEHAKREDVPRAARLREALRSVLRSHVGEVVDEGAVGTLNEAVEQAALTVQFTPVGEVRLEPGAAGVAGALGRLLSAVAGAMADGTWNRLKVCRADTCRWAFYDHTRNRSGTWCDMAVCGNRTKVRAYRRRRKVG
jgi:predicted RNA-binding Zn ribbon-like protein